MLLAADPAPAVLGVPDPFWIWPFVALLAAIAILPLTRMTHRWWEKNGVKLIVSGVLGGCTLLYYLFRGFGFHGSPPGLPAVTAVLVHAILHEYVPFLTLLLSLYVIAGGILVRGDLRATPAANTLLLLAGGVLASLVGTTGASMLLIRVLLRSNRERRHVIHTVVFFIFIVGNVGGSLLPIGDPPLFLGYLRGVPFLWTLRLLPAWAFMMGCLLIVYYIWDGIMFSRETLRDLARDLRQREPLRVVGIHNLPLLALVVLAVVLLDPSKPLGGWTPAPFLREVVMLALVGVSRALTPQRIYRENGFNYVAIAEVAALFIGIFVTMQVPIELLHAWAPRFASAGFLHPGQYFWATGLLSSFLDNAPTYVVFFETANQLTHQPGPGIIRLVSGDYIREDLLLAISCGAVFMGANTYIGNGPNFMIKTIAERSGVRMPSFFGFLVYSGCVLLPLFAILTACFFA